MKKGQRRVWPGKQRGRAEGERVNGEQMPEIRMRIVCVRSDRSELCCWVSEERVPMKRVQISLCKAQWPI